MTLVPIIFHYLVKLMQHYRICFSVLEIYHLCELILDKLSVK